MSEDLSQLKQNIRALLQDLTALPAVSGHEQPVVRHLAGRLRPLADEVEVDRFGNVTATRRGPEGAPRIVGTVHHPAVLKAIKAAALREGIPLQVSVSGHWTTDAAAFHTAAGGIPTGFISIPRRYAHSPAEVLDLNDPAQAVRLLVSLARDPGTGRDLSFI